MILIAWLLSQLVDSRNSYLSHFYYLIYFWLKFPCYLFSAEEYSDSRGPASLPIHPLVSQSLRFPNWHGRLILRTGHIACIAKRFNNKWGNSAECSGGSRFPQSVTPSHRHSTVRFCIRIRLFYSPSVSLVFYFFKFLSLNNYIMF